VGRDLTCRELVEIVTDHLDGVLPARERERFEAHLSGCDGCEAYVEQIRATIDLTARIRELDAQPEMAALLQAFRDYGAGA
jgi:anti-sigma factor RsiW